MRRIFLVLLLCGSMQSFAAEKAADARKCAEELMLASGVPEMLKRAFASQLENQFKALPELEKIRPQLTEFYAKAFSFEALKKELANICIKYYSVEEMRQITAFYRTPAGRKKAAVDGLMSKELGELFLKHSQAKMPELQKLLQKLIRK